ncbi:MAG: DUF1592 domain-containing protein [Verrucomicrobia subdivision 3 bacterium]|nr:DUF1592 domain-containing protein [Limisphaerales bacterium]
MRKLSLSTVTAFLGLVSFAGAADLEVELPKKHFALIESYCLDCHDGETQKGKVNLEALSFKVGTLEQAELWQKVLNAMNSGEMPPENKRQPKNEEKADFLDDLAQTMVLARRKLSDSGGKITMRRLNRREYHNTIESLTGVSLNVESLPSDEGTGTFDTVGASQFISSDQFEQYLRLGRTAIDEAFVRHSTRAKPTKVFRVELEESVNPKKLEIVKKLEETYQKKWLPWKEGVDKAAKAPENQQIVAELRKKHPNYDTDPVLKYKMAGLLKGAPDPRDYGGSDPINAVAALYSPYRRYHSYMKHYAKLPHNDRGAYLQLSRGIQRFDIHPDPKDVPSGTYKLRIRAGAVKGSDPSRHFIEIGHPQNLNGTSPGFTKLLSMQQISGTIENPEIIEVYVEFGERTPRVIGIQERQPKSAKLVREEFDRHKQKNGYGTPPAIWVDWMELEGPIKETAGQTFRVEPETTVNVQSAKAMKQMEETYKRYLGWKAGVDKAALAPENQKALEQIRKKHNLTDLTDNIRLYQNANLLKGVPDPKKFGFKDANDASFSYQGGYGRKYAYLKHYAELPLSDRGTYLKLGWGIQRIDVTPPKDKLVPGTYKLRIRAGSVKGSDPKRHFIQIGHPQRLNGIMAGFVGKPINGHQVNGTTENPEIIETTVKIGADTPREFGIQERQPEDRNLHRKEFYRIKQENGYGYPPAVWVDWIELEGPLPKAGTKVGLARILTDNLVGPKESESERARKILSEFSLTAFRQVKPAPKFIDQLLALFKTRRTAGEPFEVAIRTPLSVILASPGFLYLNEPNVEKQRRTLTDRELAVRLAYFLWSAPPDAELLALAAKNALHKPATLRQQVSRLLTDPRSDEFVSGFVHQWLHMERLDFFQFDTKLHREFDESVRASARREVYESFAHLLRDPDSGRLGKLLKSDYVFINGLLANYYGIEGVTGEEFRKVKLPVGSPRGGLLGTAAIHAMGSDGVESSPVERGAWVLRYLLNDPSPPAPPNVPQLSRLADKPLTVREKLSAHQEEAQCASCHRKIDPIGFGLENFDAAGKWRTTGVNRTKAGRNWKTNKTWEIDASGAFHKGPAFADYFELRDRVAEREPDFARGFTEALISYSLGRPFGFTDEDLANEILTAAKANQYSVSEFIQSLVLSQPFRMK